MSIEYNVLGTKLDQGFFKVISVRPHLKHRDLY